MEKICEYCGKKFKAKRETTKFCSRGCYREALQNKSRKAGEKQAKPFDLKLNRVMPPLNSLSGEELLHYGKLSYKGQINAERREKLLRQRRLERYGRSAAHE